MHYKMYSGIIKPTLSPRADCCSLQKKNTKKRITLNLLVMALNIQLNILIRICCTILCNSYFGWPSFHPSKCDSELVHARVSYLQKPVFVKTASFGHQPLGTLEIPCGVRAHPRVSWFTATRVVIGWDF